MGSEIQRTTPVSINFHQIKPDSGARSQSPPNPQAAPYQIHSEICTVNCPGSNSSVASSGFAGSRWNCSESAGFRSLGSHWPIPTRIPHNHDSRPNQIQLFFLVQQIEILQQVRNPLSINHLAEQLKIRWFYRLQGLWGRGNLIGFWSIRILMDIS